MTRAKATRAELEEMDRLLWNAGCKAVDAANASRAAVGKPRMAEVEELNMRWKAAARMAWQLGAKPPPARRKE